MKTYDLKELSTATSKMPKTGGAFTGAVTSNSNVTTTGTVTANKLVKSGGTNAQLLLANGDSKATSDFATSGHNHDNTYLKLAGGTLTGAVSSNSNITSSANLTGAKIIKSGGTNAQLLLANGDTKPTSDFAASVHTHKAWKRVWKKEVTEEQSTYWTYIYVNPELELAYFVAEVDSIRLSNGHRHIIASESTSSSLKKAMFPIDTLFITARIDGSVRIGFYGVQINSNGEGVSGFGSNVEYTIQFYDSNNTQGTSSQSGYASAVYKPQGTYQQLNDLPEV